MIYSDTIEIPLSKSKLAFAFAGAIVFVGCGIWFVIEPATFQRSIYSNPVIIIGFGISAILFFGLMTYVIGKRLFDNSPGLIISDKGIFDNSGGLRVGFVPWNDVIQIDETHILNQKLINIVVKNPQDYIDRQKSGFRRKAMQMNYDSYGSVIGISVNGLKCDFEELKSILHQKFAAFKSKTF